MRASALHACKEAAMDQEIHKSTDEARAGHTPHIVRYVLGISLALVVIAFLVIVIVGLVPRPPAG